MGSVEIGKILRLENAASLKVDDRLLLHLKGLLIARSAVAQDAIRIYQNEQVYQNHIDLLDAYDDNIDKLLGTVRTSKP